MLTGYLSILRHPAKKCSWSEFANLKLGYAASAIALSFITLINSGNIIRKIQIGGEKGEGGSASNNSSPSGPVSNVISNCMIGSKSKKNDFSFFSFLRF